ncbi:hypothetical protein AC579_8474 [Pseudocercospora musae]|uniref:Uncharacterized protein n=1 Tax=Pseudocercospora musae TaxID=113226 RepID=A0A139I1W4_9PEZI|nr:hypothetical protein AC579_8474 [Pseudocercospora musae]
MTALLTPGLVGESVSTAFSHDPMRYRQAVPPTASPPYIRGPTRTYAWWSQSVASAGGLRA